MRIQQLCAIAGKIDEEVGCGRARLVFPRPARCTRNELCVNMLQDGRAGRFIILEQRQILHSHTVACGHAAA